MTTEEQFQSSVKQNLLGRGERIEAFYSSLEMLIRSQPWTMFAFCLGKPLQLWQHLNGRRKKFQVGILYSSRFMRRASPKYRCFLFAWEESAFGDILKPIVNFFGSLNLRQLEFGRHHHQQWCCVKEDEIHLQCVNSWFRAQILFSWIALLSFPALFVLCCIVSWRKILFDSSIWRSTLTQLNSAFTHTLSLISGTHLLNNLLEEYCFVGVLKLLVLLCPNNTWRLKAGSLGGRSPLPFSASSSLE